MRDALGTYASVSIPIKHLNSFNPTLSYGELIFHTKLLLNEILWFFHSNEIWFGTDTPTTSFLDFSRLEHAQAAYEHTEQPTIQLGNLSFMDANFVMPLDTVRIKSKKEVKNNS